MTEIIYMINILIKYYLKNNLENPVLFFIFLIFVYNKYQIIWLQRLFECIFTE